MKPIPGLQIEKQPEAVLKRLCLWGEARGESNLGKLAVLWVVKNRATKRGTTPAVEILRPLQFSSFNDNDPNRDKLLDGWKTDPASWAACDAVCELEETGHTIDPTGGALLYYALSMNPGPHWGRGAPSWQEHTVIGGHVFGTELLT